MNRLATPGGVLAVVGFGVFIAADDLTVASTMLRQIIDDLNIRLPDEIDRAAWIVNAYLIAYVAVMPIAGRISDIWGRRRTFIAALVVFAAGSAWLPFTASLRPFLAARVLTAIGGGAMVPVALAAIGDAFPTERRGRGFGALAAIDTLGWVWGPMFGALLVRFLDWRWQFYLNVPLALLAIVLAARSLRGVGTPRRRPLDLPGVVAATLALIGVVTGLLIGARLSTTAELAGLPTEGPPPSWPWLATAAAATLFFVLWERRVADPLIDPQLLRAPGVRPGLAANVAIGGTLAVALVNVPLFVNLVIETDTERAALLSGAVLTALTALMAAAAPVGGRLTDSWSPRGAAAVGAVMATISLGFMGLTWNVGTGPGEMALALGVLGAGVGVATPPLTTVVVGASDRDRRGTGAASVVIARLVGIAVGLAGLTAWALHRFDQLRRELTLPPLTDPGYEEAATAAQADMTATALGETFIAASLAALVATALVARLPRLSGTR